jgi:hypothetical protein
MKIRKSVDPSKFVVGWREWLALPELGIDQIKAKIDTGARSSSLHVTKLTTEMVDGVEIATFRIHPGQRKSLPVIEASARVLEWREIRSSNGHRSERPVVVTLVRVGDREYPIELTLTSRDEMGFRMLLGREAVRRRALVDPGRSYLCGRKK